MEYASERNYGCRINEYTFRGQRMLSLENERIKAVILLDKGSDIYQIIDKASDIDVLWKKPGGIRNPGKHTVTQPQDFGNFEDYYFGGWQDIFPGGGPTVYKGANIGLHGEAPLLPWHFSVLEDRADRIKIALSCLTYRVPLRAYKTITLETGKSALYFEESIRNDSDVPIEFIWGQHPTYGDTFIDSGCMIESNVGRIIAGGKEVYSESRYRAGDEGQWPLIKDREGQMEDLSKLSSGRKDSAELFYMGGFQEEIGWYALKNPAKDLNVGMVFDTKVFSQLWMWRIFNGVKEYPLYGRSYHIALEPFSSSPNNLEEACSKGTALRLEGNGQISTSYTFLIFKGQETISQITKDGTVTTK